MGFFLPMIAGAVTQIGGNIIGSMASGNDQDRARAAMAQAWQEINAVGAPPDLSAEIIREKLKQVGIYNPKLEDAITQDVSKLSQIKEDPGLRGAQTQALQLLQQRGSTGLSPEDRAAYNQIRNQVAKEDTGRRQRIMQQMAERGMSGSGAELAAQLQSAQSSDQALSESGDRLAAMASQNALQALTSAGNLGGQIRGQDFDVNRTRAAAEDELNRFNTSNQVTRQQRNVASQNQGQLFNLTEQQRIQDENTRMLNAERDRQALAKRQNWLDRMSQAQAKANALTGQAQAAQQQADATKQNWANAASGLGGLSSQFGDYMQKQALADKLVAKPAQPSIINQILAEKEEDQVPGMYKTKPILY